MHVPISALRVVNDERILETCSKSTIEGVASVKVSYRGLLIVQVHYRGRSVGRYEQQMIPLTPSNCIRGKATSGSYSQMRSMLPRCQEETQYCCKKSRRGSVLGVLDLG